MPETTWPAGVIGRYLTAGGATVDLRATDDNSHWYDCAGCGHRWTHPSESCIRRNAQAHAEKCRAIPRPTA